MLFWVNIRIIWIKMARLTYQQLIDKHIKILNSLRTKLGFLASK